MAQPTCHARTRLTAIRPHWPAKQGSIESRKISERLNQEGLKECPLPTVLRHGQYRLFFYSNEAGEPMDVHVARDRDVAKFWLEPVRLQRSGGFNPVEINRIANLVEEHREGIIEAWHGHFGN